MAEAHLLELVVTDIAPLTDKLRRPLSLTLVHSEVAGLFRMPDKLCLSNGLICSCIKTSLMVFFISPEGPGGRGIGRRRIPFLFIVFVNLVN